MFKVRSVSSAILVLAACSATCIGQTLPATFKTQTYTQRASVSPYLVDVNNDGIPDVIQQIPPPNTGTAVTSTFTVRLSNGSGSFAAPVSYSMSFKFAGTPSMVSGDFNGDGKVDLIFALSRGGNQVVLFLGNGDGTFHAPRYIPVALPSGQQLGISLLTTDFNGDGKLDLVVNTGNPNAQNPGGGIYLMLGNGAGNFGSPILIYTPPEYNLADAALAGDFDGDGRADIAVFDNYDGTLDESGTLHILYNNGDTNFTDIATNLHSYGEPPFSAGDLDSDGRTDIFAADVSGYPEVDVLYGQADRTFHMYTVASAAGPFAIADFNGDTRMDLVGAAINSTETGPELNFLLAGSGEGTFTEQTYAVPISQTHPGLSYPLVGDLNSDTKPDYLGVLEGAGTTSTSILLEVLNTTPSGNWGGCAYPKAGQGIHVCLPSGSIGSNTVHFNASANSFGQLRKIELWVDGKKVTEQYHVWGSRAWFDFSDTLASGAHRGVIFAADIDNRQQQTVFNFTVGGAACIAPSTAGVNICSPASGSTVSSPVQVQATSKVTGTIAHMQLWVDGVSKFTSASTTLTTSISLAAGTHRFAVVATNTAGQKWQSAINATVK